MGLGSGVGTGASGVMLGPVAKTEDPLLHAEIAAFDVDALAFAAMSERFIDQLKAGEAHPAMPSMMKYAGTELNKRRNELIMAAGGSDALEWESEQSKGGKPARDWLRSKANSIEGGTSEIQLGIVAKHILRLPGA
jgi:alkylation response protein AidB-like acyl-CoA dehydrogenase